jgi:hypothetical protein
MQLAQRFPTICALSIDQQLAPTLDFLQQRIGLKDDKLRELVRRQPSILNVSVQDHLEPNIAWLEQRLQLGGGDQESLQKVVLLLTPMVGGLAQLLGSNNCNNMQETLEPTLCWLQEKLSLGDDSIVQLVQKEASFLGLSLESLKIRVTWFQERLVLDDKSLSKLVQRFPQVLHLSVDDNLEPKLAWLQERLTLSDKSLNKLV